MVTCKIKNKCKDNFHKMRLQKVELVTARKALALCHTSATFLGNITSHCWSKYHVTCMHGPCHTLCSFFLHLFLCFFPYFSTSIIFISLTHTSVPSHFSTPCVIITFRSFFPIFEKKIFVITAPKIKKCSLII